MKYCHYTEAWTASCSHDTTSWIINILHDSTILWSQIHTLLVCIAEIPRHEFEIHQKCFLFWNKEPLKQLILSFMLTTRWGSKPKRVCGWGVRPHILEKLCANILTHSQLITSHWVAGQERRGELVMMRRRRERGKNRAEAMRKRWAEKEERRRRSVGDERQSAI